MRRSLSYCVQGNTNSSNLNGFKRSTLDMLTFSCAHIFPRLLDSWNMPEALDLANPLHLALSISPICLFTPNNLLSKSNRISAEGMLQVGPQLFTSVLSIDCLQAWKAFNGPIPVQIRRVEFVIWTAIFDIAERGCNIEPTLASTLRHIEIYCEERMFYNWFSPGTEFFRMIDLWINIP